MSQCPAESCRAGEPVQRPLTEEEAELANQAKARRQPSWICSYCGCAWDYDVDQRRKVVIGFVEGDRWIDLIDYRPY